MINVQTDFDKRANVEQAVLTDEQSIFLWALIVTQAIVVERLKIGLGRLRAKRQGFQWVPINYSAGK